MRKIDTPVMKFGFLLSAALVIVVVWSMSSSYLNDFDDKGIDESRGQEAYRTYINTDLGFSALLPVAFTEQSDYFYYELGPGREIPGVKFNIPQIMATGTNLSSDSGISIELLSRANCIPDYFLAHSGTSTLISVGEYEYTGATSSNAGAGNFYEESIFTYKNSDLCYGVRYFIHSTQIDNYPEGAVMDFDRKKMVDVFNSVLQSIKFI